MRKNTLFMKIKTLEIKSCLLHLSFGFYTLFHCNLELVVKGRMYPCIRIVILLNSVTIPCWYRYRLEWYRYRFATGAFLYGGTGSGWPLLISCFGVPVPVRVVPVPLPLHLLPNIFALPKTSPQRFPSSSMIHIRSLDPNTCNNYA